VRLPARLAFFVGRRPVNEPGKIFVGYWSWTEIAGDGKLMTVRPAKGAKGREISIFLFSRFFAPFAGRIS
jgi:hypothetical protein